MLALLVLGRWGGGSWLTNGREICVWTIVSPVGHCNSLYLSSVNIGAQLRKILTPWGPQNRNAKSSTFQMSHFQKNVSDLEIVRTDVY